MTTATINNIALPHALFVNEFANSAVSQDVQHTEDGRKFVFLQFKQNNTEPELDCGFMPYSDVKALKALRDAGRPVIFSTKDGQVFNVLINSIEAEAVHEFTEYDDSDFFNVTLKLTQI